MEIFKPLKEEILERWSLSLAVRIKWEGLYLHTRKWAVTGKWASWELSQPETWPWMMWNKFVCLSHPVSDICFCLVAKSCLTLATLWTVTPRLLCPMGSSVCSWAKILEWFAIFSSRGSSQPRCWTWVSCTAGRFFSTEPPGKPVPSITIDLLTLK